MQIHSSHNLLTPKKPKKQTPQNCQNGLSPFSLNSSNIDSVSFSGKKDRTCPKSKKRVPWRNPKTGQVEYLPRSTAYGRQLVQWRNPTTGEVKIVRASTARSQRLVPRTNPKTGNVEYVPYNKAVNQRLVQAVNPKTGEVETVPASRAKYWNSKRAEGRGVLNITDLLINGQPGDQSNEAGEGISTSDLPPQAAPGFLPETCREGSGFFPFRPDRFDGGGSGVLNITDLLINGQPGDQSNEAGEGISTSDLPPQAAPGFLPETCREGSGFFSFRPDRFDGGGSGPPGLV